MIYREPNGTMAAIASTETPPENDCINLEQFEWLFTYQPPYMWFIFVLGFVENLFVISVFIFHKSRCTVAEIYLGNMAAADLIFVSGLPFWAIYISNRFYWPFGGFMCAAVSSLIQINLYSSIYFLMMVSIDRYLALVKTMSIGRLRRPWWAKVNCAIIWSFAAVLSIPTIVFRKVMFITKLNTTACITDISPNWSVATNITLNVLGFLVPLVAIAFCTLQIICVLRNNAMQHFKEVKNEKKATWLVLSVLLVFVVCWLPFHVSTFIDTLDTFHVFPSCTVPSFNHILNQISTYIGFSNSCINPVMYIMVGNHFRQKARSVYSRLLGKGPNRRKSSFPTDESVNSTQISITMLPYKKKSIA
ncbi:B2 bradykinin receptor-like [Hyla sarda]|uniref:B2 bradykinin receptor-like n=1 Tax=Hyla sarda TaxID=327740 RepID=UPI0024C39E1F|nr:B2 bradykinin receptor-like [Hyla sarda]XP_056402653.1 B2 bradykinin receptor-like [Hyla sarda]XP_056402654.1 B2 bradykinin receptor-like [Hyla sarda]XP_056402655.1 B2 bradykinin receptor-like [Hyla sarda]